YLCWSLTGLGTADSQEQRGVIPGQPVTWAQHMEGLELGWAERSRGRLRSAK
ncbi:hypothetical protein P7K49_010239, partial [Saguinus oedipus]